SIPWRQHQITGITFTTDYPSTRRPEPIRVQDIRRGCIVVEWCHDRPDAKLCSDDRGRRSSIIYHWRSASVLCLERIAQRSNWSLSVTAGRTFGRYRTGGYSAA